MYPRDSLFKAAFNYQSGANCDFSVYAGRNKLGYSIAFLVYAGRPQYGQGFNDLLRVIWRFFCPVAMENAKMLLKAGSEAIKEGATVKYVFSATQKPTFGAVFGATAEQFASRLTEKPMAALPPLSPFIRSRPYCRNRQSLEGLWLLPSAKNRMQIVLYKTRAPLVKRILKKFTLRPINCNFQALTSQCPG